MICSCEHLFHFYNIYARACSSFNILFFYETSHNSTILKTDTLFDYLF